MTNSLYIFIPLWTATVIVSFAPLILRRFKKNNPCARGHDYSELQNYNEQINHFDLERCFGSCKFEVKLICRRCRRGTLAIALATQEGNEAKGLYSDKVTGEHICFRRELGIWKWYAQERKRRHE